MEGIKSGAQPALSLDALDTGPERIDEFFAREEETGTIGQPGEQGGYILPPHRAEGLRVSGDNQIPEHANPQLHSWNSGAQSHRTCADGGHARPHAGGRQPRERCQGAMTVQLIPTGTA
jgi:hypothetical protein